MCHHLAGNGELPTIAIAASVVAFIIIAIILFSTRFCFLRRKTKKNHNLTVDETGNVDGNEISEPESFLYDLSSIKAATNNFSADNKIGEGGFGEVFKGNLTNGQQVAVKRLSKHSGQGEREFKNEVLVLAKLQHRNLVSLLGYCLEKEEKMLIYEYVPNESLDFILFDEHKKQSLDWSKRYKIIGGVARGILYLHEDSRLRIIHRDIKASNVLLDTDMNAKISDFGLARIVGFDEVQAFKLWTEGKHFDLVDTALGDSFSKTEVTQCIHIGLLCVQEDLGDRPTMASVVHMLNSSSMTSLPIPHQPAFFLQGGVLPISNLPVPLRLSVN